ncbi:nitrite reductase small subunit NirD [Ketobacter sp.]|nr:MAG: nitrite reductase (NAD(P)H) small subunit [Ketobacter sp.]
MNANAAIVESNENWVPVCDFADLLANVGVCAKIADRQVAIFKVTDQGKEDLYAIDNHDPFSNANVLSRGIVGDLKGRNVVASPIYKQHFDLSTGECLEEEVSIPVYQVRDNGGKIEVLLGG